MPLLAKKRNYIF